MTYVRIISLLFILFGMLLILFISYKSRKNCNFVKKRKTGKKFCVLVPARYESKVITGLLDSIKNQSYKISMEDVYVIIESEEDETNMICKRYGASIIIRKKLDLKSKGYALDEAVQKILSQNKKYDAYFIFDADNVLEKDYFKNMVKVLDKGYDIATGYRNCKNGNDSVIAASSALTFSLVNTVFNDRKCKNTKNITLSGTGFYISGYLIEKWRCYPFHSLTEDYELSCYAILNNLTTYYETSACFYDEQPITYKQTINQRIRWIKGYFNVRKMYAKKIRKAISNDSVNKGSKIDETFGIIPYIIIIIGIIVWLIASILNIIYSLVIKTFSISNLIETVIIVLLIYLALLLITLLMLVKEGKKINLSKKNRLKVLFFNPIFMMTYVPCAVKAILKKEVTWTRVEHGARK